MFLYHLSSHMLTIIILSNGLAFGLTSLFSSYLRPPPIMITTVASGVTSLSLSLSRTIPLLYKWPDYISLSLRTISSSRPTVSHSALIVLTFFPLALNFPKAQLCSKLTLTHSLLTSNLNLLYRIGLRINFSLNSSFTNLSLFSRSHIPLLTLVITRFSASKLFNFIQGTPLRLWLYTIQFLPLIVLTHIFTSSSHISNYSTHRVTLAISYTINCTCTRQELYSRL